MNDAICVELKVKETQWLSIACDFHSLITLGHLCPLECFAHNSIIRCHYDETSWFLDFICCSWRAFAVLNVGFSSSRTYKFACIYWRWRSSSGLSRFFWLFLSFLRAFFSHLLQKNRVCETISPLQNLFTMKQKTRK